MKKDCLILGGIIADLYYEIEGLPPRGQDGFITGEYMAAGGCALNIAVTDANLGGRPYVVSYVGNDDYADMLREYMKEHDLPDRYIKETEGKSGKCLIFSEPDGERTFLTEKGAETLFDEKMAEDILKEDFGAAAVTGYYLLNENAADVVHLTEILRQRGTKILFDPGPLAGHIDREVLARIVTAADLMTPNDSELAYVFADKKEMDAAIDAGKTIIVKAGSSGGRVISRDGSFAYRAEKADAVDTTGAGDSFAGALLYALTQDMDIHEAVKLAARCAAVTVEKKGPHGFWKLEE